MQKTVNRIITVILVFMMCLSLLPIRSLAENDCEHPNLTEDGWKIEIPADCTEKGVKTQHCDKCNTDVKAEIPSVGHDWDDGEVTKEPTCTEQGIRTFTCKRCKKTDTKAIDVTEHVWSEWKTAQLPTCTQEGVKTRSCSMCEKVENDSIPSTHPEGHFWGTTSTVVTPTCTKEGIGLRTCTVCNVSEEVTIPATEHSFGDYSTTKQATCTADGSKERICSTCQEKDIIAIPALHPEGHAWNDQGVCSRCNITGFRLTVSVEGPGRASVNGTTVNSSEMYNYEGGTQITVIFTPDSDTQNAALDNVIKDGINQTLSPDGYTIMAIAGGSSQIKGTFSIHTPDSPASKTVATPRKAISTSSSAITAAETLREQIATANKVTSDKIQYTVYDVTPVWNDGSVMTDTEIAATDGITFTLDAPNGTSAATHTFRVYHFNGSTYDLVANSRTVTTRNFSEFTVYAIPIASSAPAARGNQLAPSGLQVTDRIDDGTKMTGSISGLTTAMEFKLKDSSAPYIRVSASTLTNLGAGTYLVRYAETTTLNPSPATEVTIADWYTVTAVISYGRGTYSVDRPTYDGKSNVFLVRKGDSIKFTFTPASGYWLHEININGNYVGSSNVKNPFTINGVKGQMTVSFGFSSSSSSPKTADNSDIGKWCAAEVVSLLGMVSITWYLFRKKEY